MLNGELLIALKVDHVGEYVKCSIAVREHLGDYQLMCPVCARVWTTGLQNEVKDHTHSCMHKSAGASE